MTDSFGEFTTIGSPVVERVRMYAGGVPDEWVMTYDPDKARFPDDAYDRALVEQHAAKIGLTWMDYCRERDRIKLPSGGFAREVWERCTLESRQNMMEQLLAMPDGFHNLPENWGTW